MTIKKRQGGQLKKIIKSKAVESGYATPSDQALLDVIQSNIQRHPGNDNMSIEQRKRPKLGLVGSVMSGMAFGGVMLIAVVVMAIFKLVPSAEDNHY